MVRMLASKSADFCLDSARLSALTALLARGVALHCAARLSTQLCTKAVQLTAARSRETRYGVALEAILPCLTAIKEEIDEQYKQ